MRLALAVIGGCLAASAAAPEELPFDPMVIEQCLATGFAEPCIGLAAGACVVDQGPMSEGLCRGRETAWWRARAEAAMARLTAAEPEIAARARRLGWPDPVPSLTAVEAGFAAYLRAACDWRMAQWDGIHAGFEGAECEMRLTARHALWLDAQVQALP